MPSVRGVWEHIYLPLGLAFFTGFASMPSNDLFLLGTPFKKLRPWIVGWGWLPFRKASLWDRAMFCSRFWALESISAHSWKPWAWARSAAVSPLAFLILHNERASVRHTHCMLDSHKSETKHIQAHTHITIYTHPHRHTYIHTYTHTHTHTHTHTQTH